MRSAASVAEFKQAPYGSYFLGRRHVVFAYSRRLIGLSFFGRPTVDDVREALSLCEIELTPDASPHDFVADTRRLDALDAESFELCVAFTRKNRIVLAEKVLRKVMLRPAGIAGAVIAGFANVAELPHPEEVFADVDKAIAWLGIDRHEGLALFSELDAILANVDRGSSVVERLRTILERDGVVSELDAARRIGISARSLQRELGRAGTTYRNELEMSRMKRAKSLLLEEGHTLAFVAEEVGFSSTQHFTTAFRRAVGTTPAEWRRGERGDPTR